MIIRWEYWPNKIGKTQDDPTISSSYVDDMRAAIKEVESLKHIYGKNLGTITVTITLHEGR